MRISKKATQKNFRVNTGYYTESEIIAMEKHEIIEWLFSKNYVIFATNISVVKVVLDEFGYYSTVAVTHEGNEIFIHI